MLRESAWKKQQSILEEDSNSLSILKKEISKQSEIDASVQLSISQKIEVLKQNATVLAKKLENEKHKNVELETIIGHLRNVLEKEKLQQASNRDSNSFESLSGLENRFKKYEYDLGQLNGKTNRIAENVEEKRIKIKQNRTERVIDSGIFRNIEKQLIQSELKFKKLLIQKIKYQKEYQKLLKKYEGLKEHAQNYNEQQQNKLKTGSSDPSLPSLNDATNKTNNKFTSIEMLKDGITINPKSMTFIEEEHLFEEQKNIIMIKKLLSQTGLESCEQLLYHFNHIDEVNDRYFNQMMLYADQSNEIQRYLNQFSHLRNENKIHFYQTKRKPTKNQALKEEEKRLKSVINQTTQLTKIEIDQITAVFSDKNFSKFLNCFGLQECTLVEGEQHFDEIKSVLQNLQSQMNQILSKGTTIREQKYCSSRSNQQEKLEQLINRVRKPDENLNVMKKEQFQEEYHKILKTSGSKTSLMKPPPKRQSCFKAKKS